MTDLSDQLQALEKGYHGLTDAAEFDPIAADTRVYIKKCLAELIISDELELEIDGFSSPMTQAILGQAVNEICNDVFGSEDYNCTWKTHKKWLGEAIEFASLAA